jgi:hypothetical protein
MKEFLLRLMASLNFISVFFIFARIRPTGWNSFAGVFSLANGYANLRGNESATEISKIIECLLVLFQCTNSSPTLKLPYN